MAYEDRLDKVSKVLDGFLGVFETKGFQLIGFGTFLYSAYTHEYNGITAGLLLQLIGSSNERNSRKLSELEKKLSVPKQG